MPSVTVPGQAERRTDRDDLLPDLDVAGGSQLDRGEIGLAVDLDDREIGHRVGADRAWRPPCVPSEKATVSLPPWRPRLPRDCWSGSVPSDDRTTPDPSPPEPPAVATSIWTTLGHHLVRDGLHRTCRCVRGRGRGVVLGGVRGNWSPRRRCRSGPWRATPPRHRCRRSTRASATAPARRWRYGPDAWSRSPSIPPRPVRGPDDPGNGP